MKKKLILSLSVVAVLLAGLAIWYVSPIDLMNLDYNEVSEIVVFNGNTGNETHITERDQIQHIIENLNEVTMKRGKLSLGYMGYSLRMTIYLSDGSEYGGWNHFIINAAGSIRKDPFFYSVTGGTIDYSYIDAIVA